MSKNSKKTAAPSQPAQAPQSINAPVPSFMQEGASSSSQNKNSVTLGKGGDQNMQAASNDQNEKKAKEGGVPAEGRSGGLAKLKDVNQAHEILEVAKNVP